ncbi:unnamed protein product [Trifolium pratense]|uniref:Uncharacterized protein n=1 Tax=Trifolium pratense TaxID=57577 RepID=A0ACB0IPX8_TRIPR|nr:unnamed protein product [Trifolium pratense]
MVGDNIGYMVSTNKNLMMPTPSSTQLSISSRLGLPQDPRQELITSSSQRPRGRTFGSKNKPKPSVVIKENMETTMETILIEIPSGEKIVEALINWARNHQSSITLLECSGFVTDVTFIDSVSRAPTFSTEGMFYMISLSGTYLNAYCGNVPSRFITNPVFSSFSICLSQGGGRMLSGIVGGTIKAVDGILVTASLLKKPQFHRLTTMYGRIIEIEESVESESNNNVIGSTSLAPLIID